MWKEFNNNPCGRRVGDCAVRAVSVALGIDWEDAYEMITRADGMGSYRMRGSYRGSYADEGGSYRRRRDSMGRYSRAEEKEDELHDIVDQLRSMAKDLPQPTQRAIQNFTDMVG